MSYLMVDDIRIALQQVTTLRQQPDLHVFLHYQPTEWKNPNKIFEGWLRVGEAMKKPLKAIIAHHVDAPASGRIIIEGDGILPALATQNTLSDLEGFTNNNRQNKIKAIFLVEDNEAKILENLRRRGRGFNDGREEEQIAFAHASWLFGKWLRKEAQLYNLPVLAFRPHETTVKRLMEHIQ